MLNCSHDDKGSGTLSKLSLHAIHKHQASLATTFELDEIAAIESRESLCAP